MPCPVTRQRGLCPVWPCYMPQPGPSSHIAIIATIGNVRSVPSLSVVSTLLFPHSLLNEKTLQNFNKDFDKYNLILLLGSVMVPTCLIMVIYKVWGMDPGPNNGHYSNRRTRPWLRYVSECATILLGITVSLTPLFFSAYRMSTMVWKTWTRTMDIMWRFVSFC